MRRTIFLFVFVLGCGASGSWDGSDDAAPSTHPAKDASAQDSSDDASAAQDALVDDASYNSPLTCTSGTTWTGGSTKSANMEPGHACRTCHVLFGQASSKDFDISGTVYPTAHEPDDCNGVPGGITVVITDANKTDHVLTVNSVGNFYNDDGFGLLKIPTPYTAKVVSGNKVRAMLTAQTVGDCNSCHTAQGTNSAPGRIMAP